jgi:hypothetical protein
VAEERAQNRDEPRRAAARLRGLRHASDEQSARLAAAERARGDTEREIAVARCERAALEKARAAATP